MATTAKYRKQDLENFSKSYPNGTKLKQHHLSRKEFVEDKSGFVYLDDSRNYIFSDDVSE